MVSDCLGVPTLKKILQKFEVHYRGGRHDGILGIARADKYYSDGSDCSDLSYLVGVMTGHHRGPYA